MRKFPIGPRSLLISAALVLAAAAASPGEESSDGESKSGYSISLRARWWMPMMSGSYQINKGDLKGSINDFADDLDVGASSFDPRVNKGGPDLNVHVKVAGFSAGLAYTNFFTGGRTVLEDKLEMDVTEFDKGDWINSDLTLAFGRLDLRYDLISMDMLTASICLGADYFDFTTAIIGHDSAMGTEVSISDGGNGVYPVIGAAAGVALSVFEARAELYGITGDFKAIGDIRLTLVDFSASVHLRPVKYFSIGLGFRAVHMDASAVNIWHGGSDPVRFTLFGFFFEIEGRF